MSDEKNVKIRNAQRAIMHADYTQMATLLGFDAMVAGIPESLTNNTGNTTKEILDGIIEGHGKGNQGDNGIGTSNHIMILNRSAIIVSADPWHIDDIIEVVNEVRDINGQPIYDIKS